ncbi:hypothetical protein EYF80_047820 [Liparis tanakae]|uniref:Uncharacterized protein n=1 Tax=Liparis tanakae TaxID=230148 RepID=A0A4Z2FLK2_9TELE|nr:hypothetical protein EYF80_047820 [Liparis tanakae]
MAVWNHESPRAVHRSAKELRVRHMLMHRGARALHVRRHVDRDERLSTRRGVVLATPSVFFSV